MNQTEILSELSQKLDDLKGSSKFERKFVPILESLLDFIHDTAPLLEDINKSLSRSAKDIPKAANQISDVTSATELATTEILDIVDEIYNDIESNVALCEDLSRVDNEKQQIYEQLKEILSGNPEGLELLEKYAGTSSYQEKIKLINDTLNKIKDETYRITLSLQVQDITAQQLLAVNHLIDSIHKGISELLTDIEVVEEEDDLQGFVGDEKVTFDPRARYDKSDENQQRVDSIIDEANKTSQSEIDKLFS